MRKFGFESTETDVFFNFNQELTRKDAKQLQKATNNEFEISINVAEVELILMRFSILQDL